MEEIINKLINSNLKTVEKDTGIPYDRMYKWKKGKGKPKTDDLNKLIKYFSGTSSIKELEEKGISPSLNSGKNGVPYYDVDFIGGFDLVFNNQIVAPSYYIDFLPFNDSDCWLNVTGKSMGPLIAHGDIVALKELKDWKNFLLFGEIYAVVTPEYRTIKILSKGDDSNHFTLIPYNKSDEYSSQPIPKEIITHIFRVKGAIKKFF